MIAAFELDDLVATGKTTGQPYGAHTGFGTTAHHTNEINIWAPC